MKEALHPSIHHPSSMLGSFWLKLGMRSDHLNLGSRKQRISLKRATKPSSAYLVLSFSSFSFFSPIFSIINSINSLHRPVVTGQATSLPLSDPFFPLGSGTYAKNTPLIERLGMTSSFS